MTMSAFAAELLARHQVIAVVGMSATPGKEAHAVPLQIARRGWTVIPVNPHAETIGGLDVCRRLADIPVPVGLVNVFRPSEQAAAVARDAIAIGASAVWLQQGIVSPEAQHLCAEAKIDYVENLCIAVVRSVFDVHPPRGPSR